MEFKQAYNLCNSLQGCVTKGKIKEKKCGKEKSALVILHSTLLKQTIEKSI